MRGFLRSADKGSEVRCTIIYYHLILAVRAIIYDDLRMYVNASHLCRKSHQRMDIDGGFSYLAAAHRQV